MKIHLPYKHSFGIIGLPRSGTTIVNAVFDCLENGFSISEPFMSLLYNPQHLKFNKIPYLTANIDEVYPEIEKFMIQTDYDCGGTKETFRINSCNCDFILNYEPLDFIVFVFREPKYVFSSWQRSGWRHNFSNREWLLENYLTLESIYHEKVQEKPCFIIKYEEFCESEDKAEYLNNIFDGYAKFSGQIDIAPSNYISGDIKAFRSDCINMPNREVTTFASFKENRMFIAESVKPVYDRLKNF